MYKLRKGKMLMMTPNKNDIDMYVKAGWSLVEKVSNKRKNKKQQIKEEINTVVEEVLEEETVG